MNIQAASLLLLVSFIVMPYIDLSQDNIVILDISSDKQYTVFIDALYPEGFKNIDKTIVNGRSLVYLPSILRCK